MTTYLYKEPVSRSYTMEELRNLAIPVYSQWGTWTFDLELLVLRDERGYEIDVEKIDSSDELVDWIFHMTAKAMPPEKLYYLMIALRDILNPSRNDWAKVQDGKTLAQRYAHRLQNQG